MNNLLHLPVTSLNTMLSFDYPSKSTGQLKRRKVVPDGVQYGIAGDVTEPTWFLHTICLDEHTYRSFEIAKIENLQVL